MWKGFRRGVCSATEEVIPHSRHAKKEWISKATLHIVDMKRERERQDLRGYMQGNRSTGPWEEGRRRHDKRELMGQWNDLCKEWSMVWEGSQWEAKNHHPNGSLFSDPLTPHMFERWRGYFRDLMSRPPAVFSSWVDADVYTLLTSCGVSLQLKPRSQMPYPGWKTVNRIYIISPEKEMLKFGESLNSLALLSFFECIWKNPKIGIYKGIILPLYKRKGIGRSVKPL